MIDFRDFLDAVIEYGRHKQDFEEFRENAFSAPASPYAASLRESMEISAKAAEAALMKIIAKSEAGE